MGIMNSISAEACSIIGPRKSGFSPQPIVKSLSYSKALKRTVSSLSMAAGMKQQATHLDQSRSVEQLRNPIGPSCNIVWELTRCTS